MLLIVLRFMSWPFGRRRLWLTAPLVLGALAILAGSVLLWPFVQGYRALETVEIRSIGACGKNIDVYVQPVAPGQFVLAVTAKADETSLGSVEQFKAIAQSPQRSDPRLNVVEFGQSCQQMSTYFQTSKNVRIEFAGAMIANGFIASYIERGAMMGVPPASTPVGYVAADRRGTTVVEVAKPFGPMAARRSALTGEGRRAGYVYENIANPERPNSYYSAEVVADRAFASLPATAFERVPIEQLSDTPPRQVALGVSGAAFLVHCPACAGRGGWGSQLVLAVAHSSDDFGITLGDGPGEAENRIVAVSDGRWRARLLDALHGTRGQVGDHWLSTGIQANEAKALNGSAETVDGFKWERFDWLAKEQAITLFASLLLGLGITLWVELLIVFLHSISPPVAEAAAASAAAVPTILAPPPKPARKRRQRKPPPAAAKDEPGT